MSASGLKVIDQLSKTNRELLYLKREILLTAIPEIMEKLGKTEAEARRMIASATAPEVAALSSDDWESNPLILLMLEPETPDLLQRRIKAGLTRSAEVYGISDSNIINSICQNPFNSLRLKSMMLSIAFNRRLPSFP